MEVWGEGRTEDIEEWVGHGAGEGMGSEGGEKQVREEPKIKGANVKRESKGERRRIRRNYGRRGTGKAQRRYTMGEESDRENTQAVTGGRGRGDGGGGE